MTSRRNNKRRTTKRHSRKAGVTVESLHASFDKIDERVKAMIAKGSTDSELTSCIRKAWTEMFHMSLSAPAVKGMILHYRSVHKGLRKTRKAGRSQRGGMAPVDWTMGQGTTDYVYGRFPVEMGTTPQVVRALDLGRFYENRGGRSCDATGGHAAPQKGAGVLDAIMMGHAPASVPRNFLETGVSTVQGAPIRDPNPSPISATSHLASFTPRAYDATAISSISSLAPVYKSY